LAVAIACPVAQVRPERHATAEIVISLHLLAALVILREKAIRPLLAAAQEIRPSRGSQNPTALDGHYAAVRSGMAGILRELGVAAQMIDKKFVGLRP